MRQRSARRYATAPLAILAAAFLASCSAGDEAGTLDAQHLSGAKADSGLMKIRNAIVVAGESESEAAALLVTIVNDGSTDDALVGVELTGPDGPVEVTMRPAIVELPAESATVIPGASRPEIEVDGANLEAGAYLTATFSFESAGAATMQVLALSPEGVRRQLSVRSTDAYGALLRSFATSGPMGAEREGS